MEEDLKKLFYGEDAAQKLNPRSRANPFEW